MQDRIQLPKSTRIAKVAIFAALYSVTSLVPISMFIGAPSFLGLNLLIIPIIAIIFSPFDAFLCASIGGIVSFLLMPSQAMFGAYTILLPICGATFGSLVYNKGKIGAVITTAFLGLSTSLYLGVNYAFPYFVLPHIAAMILTIVLLLSRGLKTSKNIPFYAFVATMSEQGIMMIFAVYLLGLPWVAFPAVLPLMLYERLIATIGGSIIILALERIALRNNHLSIMFQRNK